MVLPATRLSGKWVEQEGGGGDVSVRCRPVPVGQPESGRWETLLLQQQQRRTFFDLVGKFLWVNSFDMQRMNGIGMFPILFEVVVRDCVWFCARVMVSDIVIVGNQFRFYNGFYRFKYKRK